MAEQPNVEFGLMPFLFGNIDDEGQLEDDILDEDCKKHLNSLCKFGLSSLLTEVIGNEHMKLEENTVIEEDPLSTADVKSPSAEDYWEEQELFDESSVVEDSCKIESKIETSTVSDVPRIENAENSMPPPLVPVSKPAVSASEPNDEVKKKLVTPLAAMLPEKYRNVDVREFFPEFRFGKVMRAISGWEFTLNDVN